MSGNNQPPEPSTNSGPDSNQKENGDERSTKNDAKQVEQNEERPAEGGEAKMSEEELLEFYRKKCGLLQSEIDERNEKCSQLETDNFELKAKIDELREMVTKSNELKEGLEEMGIDVNKYLGLIDE